MKTNTLSITRNQQKQSNNSEMDNKMERLTESETEKAEILEIKKLATKYCRRKHTNQIFTGIVKKDVYGNFCAEMQGNIYGNIFLATLSHLELVAGKKI